MSKVVKSNVRKVEGLSRKEQSDCPVSERSLRDSDEGTYRGLYGIEGQSEISFS